MDDDLILISPPFIRKENTVNLIESEGEDKELSDSEESSACPICFEPWSSSGKHRIVSLKCGHLFGKQCIERWLTHPSHTTAAGLGKCPQCNAMSKKSDIRVLFVSRKLVTVDKNGREEELAKQLEEEKRNKQLVLQREATLQQELQITRAEVIRLKEQIAQMKLEKLFTPNRQVKYTYSRQSTLASNTDASCKCLWIDEHYRTAIVSKSCQSSHGLFRVSLDVNQHSALLPTLHDKPIKGIAGSNFKDGLIGTVGLDSRLKLTSLQSGQMIAEWGLTSPGWSVAFDSKDRNIIYTGLSNRRLAVFDVRVTKQALYESVVVDCGQPPLPVHSLYSAVDGDGLKYLIGATMNGMFLSDSNDISDASVIKTANNTSNCSGLAVYNDHLMVTCRKVEDPSQISIFSLSSENPCQPVTVFSAASGSSRLTNSALFSDLSDLKLTAAIIDEPSSSVHLWDCSTATPILRDTLSMNTSRPLQAVSLFPSTEYPMLLTLSDQQLFMYKGIST